MGDRPGSSIGRKVLQDKGDEFEVPVHVVDKRHWAHPQEGFATQDAEPERSPLPTYVEELKAELARSRARLDETLAAHRRMQSEFEEVRLRLNRDFEARVRQAKAAVFRGLLEVADHMDLALGQAAQQARAEADPLLQGVRLIHRQLLGVLRDEGLERLALVGQPFDPELAEAVAMVPTEDRDLDGCVVAEQRAGYRLGDALVRPAQVQVGRHAAAAPSPPDPGGGPGEQEAG